MPAALGNMSKHYCARLHEFWENILPTNFTNHWTIKGENDVLVRHYATGHVNKKLIALVQIRATDSVAILIHCNYSCPFVQFVGKN